VSTLRIAIPIHSFEPGGVERVALNLATAWQSDGVDVKVLLGRDAGAMKGIAPGLDYVLRPEPIPTAAWETIWMIWHSWRWLRKNRVDAVFLAGNTYAIVGAMLKLLLGKRCPPLLIKISNDLERRDMPALGRWFYRNWLRLQGRLFDAFVGMAAPMHAEIADAAGVSDERIAIVEDPSLEVAQRKALMAIPRSAATPRSPRYVAVGRLLPQKNFPHLLRSFARLDDPAARLVIVGEGTERAKLERLAAQLGISAQLTLPGHCDPTPHLAAASAFVLSSDYEGVPAVIIEALAAGLPIAGTDCSISMPAITGNGQFARLVPIRDEDALVGAMREVLTMPYDAAAARASTEVFTIPIAAARYRTLFEELAAA
jgi:glycosyltransferase involved in cell wall biosynthesis